ncbi:SMC5-SMC6 complex localization factor protein 1 isoform X1 [Anguilla anguilla]|uniref:SMC5-SMC6 complex localization factor protein 1 isoform X1 n=2 Tax=Anguilla anguilla TaxID=7936 RepID=UPI0015AED6D8|nr:SMC5-SMC6 complex localization factor protein 1 isoform X1 [Anguilla anguilla]
MRLSEVEGGMVDTKHVFQISGIKNVHTKEKLLRGIHRLGGKYIGGSTYREGTTHLIVSRPSNSEKFLAACAGGIWVVKPEYVRDSERNGAWLPEEPYEVDVASRSPGATNPVRAWRERVASGSVLGAFQGWSVVLLVDNAKRNATIKRILMSGKARVYSSAPPSDVRVTHVLTSPECKRLMSHKETCYSVDHIARHLFGSLWSEEGFNESLDTSGSSSQDCTLMDTCTELEANDVLFADLENQLRDQLSKLESLKRKLVSTEFLNATTADPQTQTVMADFSNVDSLIECGLLTEALEELQGALYPGQLPPVQVLHSLMQHALLGEVQPYFYCTFRAVLHNILRKNPSWGSPVVVKYFQRSLQCPQCKGGPRGLLELSVRFCMSSEPTCHSLPRPAPPEQVRFHVELQGLLLQLFQFELQASSMGRAGGSRSSVLVSTFWSVWDRSTLCTRAVQQLAQLLIQASLWARPSSEDWQLRIVGTLHDILAVVVEYWCQEHSRQNRDLVEKGLADLGQYIAILCHDLPPEALQEFIPSIPSVRLRMVTADAVFSHLCSQNGVVTGTEPLSLTKIVSSYLPALVRMSGRAPTKPRAPAVEPPTASCAADRGSAATAAAVAPRRGARAAEEAAAPAAPGGPGSGKQNVPRGLNRVNAAGETLLHRACKTDQVETVLRVLPLPGVDVNVKDYAGWTPLHEACNHGSSACVRALLEHCPALHLETQVDGVSPLHDALLNGHLDIAKMLLRYGGSSLLRQRDGHGRTALDLVSSPELREDLRARAREGDAAAAPDGQGSEVRDPPFLETCACLLSCLTLSYALARDVPVQEDPGPRLARALAAHSTRRVTAGWGDPALIRHAQDLETLLGAGRHLRRLPPAVRSFPGRHTRVLMRQLEQLESDGAELLGNAPA